jgi:large subunit ribosomal protein L21e
MVMRIGGFRRKTRYKLKKEIRQKGKLSLQKYFQTFKVGESVYLVAEPAIQKGMYHPRFFGKAGTILGLRGACYQVAIKDGGKDKTVLVHPVHLKRGVNNG